MDKNGQPYLRALSEDAPRPLRSVLSHLPLYFAGMLVIWTPGILNRFSGAQSVSAPWLRSVTPEIVFVTWTVLLVYTGFLILSAVRPASSTAAVASLPRRISRTIPPTIQTCLVMGLIQAGQVVIASVHRSHTPPAEELTSTVLFYGLEAAVGVATFCTLLATIALGMSRVHRWWLYGVWPKAGTKTERSVLSLHSLPMSNVPDRIIGMAWRSPDSIILIPLGSAAVSLETG